MQPEAGFAAEGDLQAAGFSDEPAGDQDQQQEQCPGAAAAAGRTPAHPLLAAQGVLQACQRAAASHRLFVQRLLPRLQVSWL